MKMRLFIAVEVPDEIKQILKDAQKKLKLEGKMTKVKEFHLTLKFLGEVSEDRMDNIKQTLAQIKFDPFDETLSGIGAFPSKNNPRVVWVGLEPHEIITAIQQQVETATNRLGFPMDNRFHPHLTLARIKFIKNKKEFLDSLDNISIPETVFRIDSFKLIRSTLTPQGPVYKTIASF